MSWVLLCSLVFISQDDAQKQLQKQVSDFARSFYAAFEKGDVAHLASVSVTPWYHDGQSVITTVDALKAELKKLVEQRDTKAGQRTPEVKLVAAYSVMKERMMAKDRELLEQVVKDDDYLALVMLKPTGRPAQASDNVVLLVRIKEGKASALGVKHTQ